MDVYYLVVETDWGPHTADECEAPCRQTAEGVFRANHPTTMRLNPWSIVSHDELVARWEAERDIPAEVGVELELAVA